MKYTFCQCQKTSLYKSLFDNNIFLEEFKNDYLIVVESSFLRSWNNQVNFISNFRSLFLHSYVVEGHMRKNYSPANEPNSPALYKIKCGIVKLLLPLSIS